MNTIEAVKVADDLLVELIKAIQAASKKGDMKALSAALRRGGIASMIVEKGSDIAENPEKFETAARDSDVDAVLPAVLKIEDKRARAEGFTRFKSAFRAASQVRKVETLLTMMSAPPKPRRRKSDKSIAKLIA